MAGFSVPLVRYFYQGLPAANAQVDVYQAGTTTRAAVYSDAALTSPLPNPVVCDAQGEAVFYVGDAQVLRLLAKTQTGALIRDIEAVYPIQNLSGALALNAHGQCRLSLSGANLLLLPKNGNRLIINGQGQTVPAAGVSLSAAALSINTAY